MPVPPAGTLTDTGSYREGNWLGYSWGLTFTSGVACDDTYAYALLSNATTASIGGGALECHLMRIPWATWTIAATERLCSFTRTTGSANIQNALARRPSDGLLACSLNDGDLYTFDPAGSYTPTYLGDLGAAPSSTMLSVAFDPIDPTVIWRVGYSLSGRWLIGTGAVSEVLPLNAYGIYFSDNGSHAAGPVAWESNNDARGVAYWNPADRMPRFPFGLRAVAAERTGVGNGNLTENSLAARAATASCQSACVDNDGRIYAATRSGGIRYVNADWTTVAALNSQNTGGRNAIAVSPDGTKLVMSFNEGLMRVV